MALWTIGAKKIYIPGDFSGFLLDHTKSTDGLVDMMSFQNEKAFCFVMDF